MAEYDRISGDIVSRECRVKAYWKRTREDEWELRVDNAAIGYVITNIAVSVLQGRTHLLRYHGRIRANDNLGFVGVWEASLIDAMKAVEFVLAVEAISTVEDPIEEDHSDYSFLLDSTDVEF